MKKYTLILILFIMSCHKENCKDGIVLNHKYNNQNGVIEMIFNNETNEKFVFFIPKEFVLRPKKILFHNRSKIENETESPTVDKIEEDYLIAKLYTKVDNEYSEILEEIYQEEKISSERYKEFEKYSFEDAIDTSLSVIMIEPNEVKVVPYQLDTLPAKNIVYTVQYAKMRDVLNRLYFIGLSHKFIDKITKKYYNEESAKYTYKLYLDDFIIKDSLRVKR